MELPYLANQFAAIKFRYFKRFHSVQTNITLNLFKCLRGSHFFAYNL
jgi:hypothetical protein